MTGLLDMGSRMMAADEERRATAGARTGAAADLERIAGVLVPLDAWARRHGHDGVAERLGPVLDYLDAALTSR